MYIAAQRVMSRTRHTAVNVYEYLHGPVTWTSPLPRRFLPEYDCGTLTKAWERSPPGANSVVSYIDIVVPDGESRTSVAQWIYAIKTGTTSWSVPNQEHVLGPLWVRFGSAPSIAPVRERSILCAYILLDVFYHREPYP